MKSAQKFHEGDKVRIAKNLGECMSHFPGKGKTATVVGSYRDQFLGFCDESDPHDQAHIYELNVRGIGRVAWYEEDQLTRI